MSPGRHRHRSNRLAAGVTAGAVLLALAVVATVALRPGRGDGPASSPAADAVSLPEPDATAEPAEVPLPAAELLWISVCGLHLPVSTRFGPYERRGDVTRGFAREPAGAVLAALHLVVQVSPQTGPEVFTSALAERVTGPDAAAFAHEVHGQYERARELAQVPYGEALCPIYATVRGYRVDSYHAEAASLRLLIEAPGPQGLPQLASALVQVAWVDGDWHLVAPPLGDWSRVRTLLPASAAGPYTPLTPQG